MSDLSVDVIVPVHSADRPIHRAVTSVLEHTSAAVQVTVIAHNIEAARIQHALGVLADSPQVTLLELTDGIPSPSGPRNFGMAHTAAPYFAFLDSDDELAPGAIDSWLSIARSTGASSVLARIERGDAGAEPLPPTRPGRTTHLHAVRDRLAYRCTPFGLISREHFGELQFTPGLQSGEDLTYSAALWFLGTNIAYDRTGPAHIMHDDSDDRVSFAKRSVAEDFAFLDAIAESDWYPRLRRSQKRALGVKNFRLHFFDAVLARLQSPEGLGAHGEDLALVARKIERMGRGSQALLSRTDRAVIDAVAAPAPDAAEVLQLLESRWNGSLETALPRNPLLAVHRQGPRWTLRDMVA